jgi:hypothetical protein
MSKMDELRALREARYERTVARSAAEPQRQPKKAEPPAFASASEPLAADPEVKLCGHRAISGRTCTREQGHAAKSHRYS